MKIKWTNQSLSNILEIEDFIARDNPVAAIKFTDKIISLVEELALFPEKGRVVPEFSVEQIREIIYKNYRIVYLVKKNSIEVLTIFESHKLLDKENLIKSKKN